MDFEKLLRVARKNELTKKEPVKCLQTKFKPPTKEQQHKDKTLSEGVQKFLARKEQEEKKKQMEAERRRLELMALRAKDPKANKRIQTMLKRTKSANKSVMEDAVDNNNTADTLAGPSQPDEDDYGFVSETSSQLYNKLIQKMYSTPSNDVPKFAPTKKPTTNNLSNTKERVKMALLKQEEEEKLPHKRKKKGKEKKDDEEDDVHLEYGAPDRDLSKTTTDQNKDKPEKPKVKKPMPPPVDFYELLKIAEQKQHEPVVFEPKVKTQQEPEVLMTKKQKLEYEKMQEWKRQRELRLQNLEKSSHAPEEKKALPKIPKQGQPVSDSKGPPKKVPDDKLPSSAKSSLKIPVKSVTKPADKVIKGTSEQKSTHVSSDKKYIDEETSRLMKERDEALGILREKERLIRERDEAVRKLKEKEQLIKERDDAIRKLKLLEEAEKARNGTKLPDKRLNGSKSAEEVKSSPMPKAGLGSSKTNPSFKKNESSPSGSVSNGVKPREFPPKDLKPSSKVAPRAGESRVIPRSKQFPPADVRRKMALKRRRIESDDEYDSELDDFIDDNDNDVGAEEVSKVISEIFKYDKNKYSRYDDVDDECMESNFAQISKEEFFSTKCGILEDLKDIQREKARLARKKKR